MVAPFTNPNPGVKVEIDGFSCYVRFVGLSLAEDGRTVILDVRITGGLVPEGEVEYVSLGSNQDCRMFIREPSSRCVPCEGEGSEYLGDWIARYVHNRRSLGEPDT